jgi:hypothetical protein
MAENRSQHNNVYRGNGPHEIVNSSRPGWSEREQEPDASGSRPQQGRNSSQNRGRGRRGGRPPGGIRPPRQADATPKVPAPAHLATTGSQPRNDPLFLSALAPSPGAELRPNVGEHRIYSGVAGLNEIVNQLYTRLVAKSTGFARRVPLSALQYYAGTIVYAQLLRQVELNGFQIARNERDFVATVRELALKPPEIIRLLCAGLGNVALPNGRMLRFDMAPRGYHDDEESNTFGWFGQVGPDNHYLYRDYPNIAVYVDTIQRTLRRTANRNLPEYDDLPEGIQPEDENHDLPNENMLGYGPAQILRPDQLQFLVGNGFNAEGEFASQHDVIPYFPDLLRNVQQEIDQCKLTLNNIEDSLDGSVSQVPLVVELDDTRRLPSLKMDLEVHSPLQVNGANVVVESAFCYRVKYKVRRAVNHRNKWSVYAFNEFQAVPAAYMQTANALRDFEPPILQVGDFRTTPFQHGARVREVHEVVTVETRRDNPR